MKRLLTLAATLLISFSPAMAVTPEECMDQTPDAKLSRVLEAMLLLNFTGEPITLPLKSGGDPMPRDVEQVLRDACSRVCSHGWSVIIVTSPDNSVSLIVGPRE